MSKEQEHRRFVGGPKDKQITKRTDKYLTSRGEFVGNNDVVRFFKPYCNSRHEEGLYELAINPTTRVEFYRWRVRRAS